LEVGSVIEFFSGLAKVYKSCGTKNGGDQKFHYDKFYAEIRSWNDRDSFHPKKIGGKVLFSLRRYYPEQVVRVLSQPHLRSTPEIQTMNKNNCVWQM